MAKTSQTIPQDYPRIQDENSLYYGCLDDSQLVEHSYKIPIERLKELAVKAIQYANGKSSREILAIPLQATPEELEIIYQKEGKKLFSYFKKYPSDPASTAHQMYGTNYRVVGIELFRNRTLQKERMNSGWRYQQLAVECAQNSGRFKNVSGIAIAEGDFSIVVEYLDAARTPLSLYVSVKNRSDTLGGQDWPKAIQALENFAKNDRNKLGAYCCIFVITMDTSGSGRRIIRDQKTKMPHSVNTEVWLPDYFWSFFANYSFAEIMTIVLDVLIDSDQSRDLSTQLEVPDKLLDAFGLACIEAGLVDELGNFNDPHQLVRFFCGQLPKQKRGKKK